MRSRLFIFRPVFSGCPSQANRQKLLNPSIPKAFKEWSKYRDLYTTTFLWCGWGILSYHHVIMSSWMTWWHDDMRTWWHDGPLKMFLTFKTSAEKFWTYHRSSWFFLRTYWQIGARSAAIFWRYHWSFMICDNFNYLF